MHCRTVNEVTAFRIFVHSLQSRYLGGKGTNKLKGFALGFFCIVLAGQDNLWDYNVCPWQPRVNKNCRETMICPCSDHDITKPSAFVSKYQSNSRQSMWSFLSFAKYPGHQNFLSYDTQKLLNSFGRGFTQDVVKGLMRGEGAVRKQVGHC